MPVKIRRRGSCFSVRTPGGIKARCTTKRKAQAQERLLNMAEHAKAKRTRTRGTRR